MTYHSKIKKVAESIAPFIRKTPLLKSDNASHELGAEIYFKCEILQHTGSFKARGAANKILSINDKNKILVTASGGNHGPAVCYIGRQLGHKVKVFLPKSTPQYKIDKVTGYGGDVTIYGDVWDEADAFAQQYAKDNNAIYIHPFSDNHVIDGQATVAYELIKQLPDVDIIIGSIGGGGLMSGISQYAKSINPKIQIYGVETVGADSMFQSIKANKIIELPSITSVAEGLGAKKVTQKTFNIAKANIDDFYRVSDDEAILAQLKILQHDKLLTEPAASCSLAALKQIPDIEGKRIAVILCGGNFSISNLKINKEIMQ